MKGSILNSMITLLAAGNFACDDVVGPPASEVEPRVVFVSNRDGNEEIYSMKTDGTGLLRLTSHSARDGRPAALDARDRVRDRHAFDALGGLRVQRLGRSPLRRARRAAGRGS